MSADHDLAAPFGRGAELEARAHAGDESSADELALEAWAFNVHLEISGRKDTNVAIGGAILDLKDLDRILERAREGGAGNSLPPGEGLRELAVRLTPNPALTVDGTLAVILDGIDRIDPEKLARALGYVLAAQDLEGIAPISDEQWAEADPASKHQLIMSAHALKNALRVMS